MLDVNTSLCVWTCVFGGAVWILWAANLLNKPTRLRQGPVWFQRFQARLLTWSSPRIAREDELKLTDRQIRSYAKRSILGGILAMILGLLSIVVKIAL